MKKREVHPHDGRRLATLERRLGVKFHNKELLRGALSVTSWPNYRLEWLGDKLLYAVAALWIFGEQPNADRRTMNREIIPLQTNRLLAKVAKHYQLDRYLVFHQYSATIANSYLADVMEAILAAIALDQGFDVLYHFLVERVFPLAEPLLEQLPGPRKTPPSTISTYKAKCRDLSEILRPFGWLMIPFVHIRVEESPTGLMHHYTIDAYGTVLGCGVGETKLSARLASLIDAINQITEGRVTIPIFPNTTDLK